MKTSRWITQGLFYALVLAVLIGRALSTGINHDENQFIATGQLMVRWGLLPYLDYPYTHMPYAIPFYALAAGISPYPFLAARVLSALAWLACALTIVAISRLLRGHLLGPARPGVAWSGLLGDFLLVAIFVEDPLSLGLMGQALNHSFATLFSLLALLLLFRGAFGRMSPTSAAFCSAACATVAGFTRFNYISLVVVVFLFWLAYALFIERLSPRTLLGWASGGVLVASLPVAALAVMAPAAFYYSSFLYIGLNTAYYRGIHFSEAMDAVSKLHEFLRATAASPMDTLLYGLLLFSSVLFLVRFLRRRSLIDLLGITVAAFCAAMFRTAFSPTPMQRQYLFAPLPFMLVLVALLGCILLRSSRLAHGLALVGLLAVFLLRPVQPGPLAELAVLARPAAWTPLQVHHFAEELSLAGHVPRGQILSLWPMLTSEVGYLPYPFAVTGPFIWRTSSLLSPQQRAEYRLTSPADLNALLDASPPVAILTGLESDHAGFTFADFGGLEQPFEDYARLRGYGPTSLQPAFLTHPLTLWLRP